MQTLVHGVAALLQGQQPDIRILDGEQLQDALAEAVVAGSGRRTVARDAEAGVAAFRVRSRSLGLVARAVDPLLRSRAASRIQSPGSSMWRRISASARFGSRERSASSSGTWRSVISSSERCVIAWVTHVVIESRMDCQTCSSMRLPDGSDDDVVEAGVGAGLRMRIVLGGGRAHVPEHLFEMREHGRVELEGGATGGDAFERGADRIDLEEIVGGDLPNLRAAKWGADDETEKLEVAQRLAHWPLADAELLRDARFDDARAGREAAAEDVFDELLADFFAEDASFERWAGAGHRGLALRLDSGECAGSPWHNHRLSIMLNRLPGCKIVPAGRPCQPASIFHQLAAAGEYP